MKVPFNNLYAQYESIRGEVDDAIADVIRESSFIGGAHVARFEEEFAAAIGVRHCVSVANGTDALYIAMKMLGIGQGHEVITTATSWISTSETISQTGATPVFVDIDPIHYTIDADAVESKITQRTRAILPVHLYGQAADLEVLRDVANRHGIFLIEDCAQAHLTQFRGQNVGTFGVASTYSFYPGKNLGAYGDAGCILTNDDAHAERFRMYANHGALQKHRHMMEGINSRLDGLQAAILRVKLRHLPEWTTQRIRAAELYDEALGGISGIIIPAVRADTRHSYHLYVIRAKNRDGLQSHLRANGIDTAIHYPSALPLLPAYNHLGMDSGDVPEAFRHQGEILSLPIFPEITREQIRYIATIIEEYYR